MTGHSGEVLAAKQKGRNRLVFKPLAGEPDPLGDPPAEAPIKLNYH
jgi:hypothetical protein